MNDYFADGQCITAEDRYEARRLFEKKNGKQPEILRDWNYATDGAL